MGFLTPLYLLGALAVSLPIVFHMIRRTPRNRREFSSVMFLQPSPPKITRRSRIEHWLLLLLRALAVCLLALAFARPFFRQSEHQALDTGDGRSFVVLLDQSASMRRAGLWDEATDQLRTFLDDDLTPADQVAVIGFNDGLHPLCDFEQWAAIDPGQRAEAVMSSVAEVSPGWGGTGLAAGLIEAAERLDVLATDKNIASHREVIVVSDLQSGSRLELLQSYEWPKNISVRLLPIGEDASPNNVGIQVVADASLGSGAAERQTRVRVTNAEGADRDEFRIRWTDEFDAQPNSTETTDEEATTADNASVSVIVPAGQSRIVRAASRPDGPGIGRLRIDGDDHEFDNLCFVPPPRPRSAIVAIVSSESADDPQGMRYYLPAALPSVPQRTIELSEWETTAASGDIVNVNLVIATGSLPSDEIESLRRYLQSGGTMLFAPAKADDLSGLYSVLDVPAGEVAETDVDEYAMLTGIDLTHPLFASLNDPRFSDFTKVRVWKHRSIPEDSIPDAKVLARFDDGDVAILETPLGDGRIVILASGWQPTDSQLALSSKFVPMLNGLIDSVAGIVERRTTYTVGEPVALAEFDVTAADVESIRIPEGEHITLPDDSEAFNATRSPGVYRFVIQESAGSSDDPPSFAVNLDPAESRTSRLTHDELESAGVPLVAAETATIIDEAAQRQLRAGELENRQKLWRWLVVAVIALLIAETLLASRAARRQLAT